MGDTWSDTGWIREREEALPGCAVGRRVFTWRDFLDARGMDARTKKPVRVSTYGLSLRLVVVACYCMASSALSIRRVTVP